jgi:serine/threonine protein kinase/tetratricopeptide (TPR) repeat protein
MTPTDPRDADERDPVDVLAEEFADRLRRGEHPSVSDYAAAHPAHADQLRELLPAVAQMEYLKRFRRAAGGAHPEQLPDRFGDFRIVRELGRGGMGVVFEAVQESLGRPVALKVLATHAQLDPTRRERFVREAQAAARLHHTNIVPVFGVGEQDGLPYYVMQLIPGQGLHAVIHQWRQQVGKATPSAGSTVVLRQTATPAGLAGPNPTTAPSLDIPKLGNWAFIAEIGLQAAEALHYAHEQGVLHRDVKPANLILDPAGRVWVADFGLAKLLDLDGLTASGDILGTLQYVAPECLTGDSGPASDVYGLGATLYELLTLEPPYPPDPPARLIKQVAETTPISPRRLNPGIPRDLETIVLKAMAREPRHRYASARDLARDLQAFLDDRPIRARRQSWLDRSVRWCRRNPSIALLTVSTTVALVLATVAGWVGYVKTERARETVAAQLAEARKARDEADQARHDAVQASIKLEANLKLSLEAFEDVFEAVGGNRANFPIFLGWGGRGGGPGGLGGPGGSPGDRHGGGPKGPPRPGDKFGGGPKGPGGPDGGTIEATVSQTAVLEAILAFYDRFAEQNRTNPRLQLEAGKAYRRVGEAQLWMALSRLGDEEKAAESFRRAVRILEQLASQVPADDAVRIELALAYMNAPSGTWPDEAVALRRAAELIAQVGPAGAWPWPPGVVRLRFALVHERLRDWAAAEAEYLQAIDVLTVAVGQRRDAAVLDLALARSGLARVLTRSGRYPTARAVLEHSVRELRPYLGGGGPFWWPLRELLAETHLQLADVSQQLGDARAAEQALAEANQLKDQSRPGGVMGGPFGGGGVPFYTGGPKKDGPGPKKN